MLNLLQISEVRSPGFPDEISHNYITDPSSRPNELVGLREVSPTLPDFNSTLLPIVLEFYRIQFCPKLIPRKRQQNLPFPPEKL